MNLCTEISDSVTRNGLNISTSTQFKNECVAQVKVNEAQINSQC